MAELEPQIGNCGDCMFFSFKTGARGYFVRMGRAGECLKPGLKLSKTYEKWTPVQALETDGQVGLARSMRLEGWSCFQAHKARMVRITPELLQAITQGEVSGEITLEVFGELTPEQRAALLTSLGIGLRYWKRLHDEKNLSD